MRKFKLLLLPFLLCLFCFFPIACEMGSDKNDSADVPFPSTGDKNASVGLKYMENIDKKSYSVQAMGSCTDKKVVVPSKHNNKPVTRIYVRAFANNRTIEEVVLPEGLLYIDSNAFLECKNLKTVSISSTVVEIGGSAFNGCESLTDVNFSKKSQLKKIGGNAFDSCTSLVTFEVPSSVQVISSYAFQYCTALEEMIFLEGATYQNDAYAIWMGCTSLKTTYLPGSFQKLGWAIFENCTALETMFVGTEDEYAMLDRYYNLNSNGPFWAAKVKHYCYSEDEPRESGYFWHYVDGKMTIWE